MSIAKHDAIKGALRLRGTCLADVAKALNVRSTTITVVSKGYRRSQRIETALAEALGMTHEQLWPERSPGASDRLPTIQMGAPGRASSALPRIARGGRMSVR